MVGLSPPLAIANELLAKELLADAPLIAPLPAQPPSEQADANDSAITQARRRTRLSRSKEFDASLIDPCDIVKTD
jgi:hypothetical protein